METVKIPVKLSEYRSLGLIFNPFERAVPVEGEGIATTLENQAMGNRLLAMIDSLADEEKTRVIWVEKSTDRPTYYHRGALIHAQKILINDDDLNVLPAYIQLFAARMGRVRSALNVVAERLSMRAFNQTLTAWVGEVIANPDEDLLADEDMAAAWAEFVESYKEDPEKAVEEAFGPYYMTRHPDQLPPIDPRATMQEAEPEETDETPEDDEIFEKIPDVLPDPNAVVDEKRDLVLEYLALYTREHLSRVVARGLRVYARDGAAALAEELKITKAPRKTLQALVRFASLRYRTTCLMYDDYDNWPLMDEDTKIKYVASMTEVKLRLGGNGLMVFFVETDLAPELEEQFGNDVRIMWDFPGVDVFGTEGTLLDEDVMERWIASATLPGSEQPFDMKDPVMVEILGQADGDLKKFCAMAAAAVDDIASRGVGKLDEAALTAAKDALAAYESESESADESEDESADS